MVYSTLQFLNYNCWTSTLEVKYDNERQRWLRCVSISPANNRVSHYKGDTLIKVSWKNFQYPNLFISTHWKQYISVVLIQYIKSIIYEYLQGKISRLKELGLWHSCPWFVSIQCCKIFARAVKQTAEYIYSADRGEHQNDSKQRYFKYNLHSDYLHLRTLRG